MAKSDTKKNSAPAKKIANRHLHARISYLYQAAHLLDSISKKTATSVEQPLEGPELLLGLSQRVASQIRPVARKAVIKVAPSIKRNICKRCNVLLIPGNSSEIHIENQSRDQTKPWADVQVVRCKTCGYEKRYPVGAVPQVKKRDRAVPDAPAT